MLKWKNNTLILEPHRRDKKVLNYYDITII